MQNEVQPNYNILSVSKDNDSAQCSPMCDDFSNYSQIVVTDTSKSHTTMIGSLDLDTSDLRSEENIDYSMTNGHSPDVGIGFPEATNSPPDDTLDDSGYGHPSYSSQQSPCRPKLDHRPLSKISVSSVCSVDTVLTDDSLDFLEEDQSMCSPEGEPQRRKESYWKKIRKVIKWSPFMQGYKKKYPWIQLAGHAGGFKPGTDGTILKKSTTNESAALLRLMSDILRSYVPEHKGEKIEDGDVYIEMQDLLYDFDCPYIMDCKMGTRTYLEDEVKKISKPRQDLYTKMVSVDPSEPTDEENANKAVTKPRYMMWREEMSSSASLGFRIEGIKRGNSDPDKDFKRVKTKQDVGDTFQKFTLQRQDIKMKYLQRLQAIKATLETSTFFKQHEVIGSSLLFVHDDTGNAGVWLIDFGKTIPLPDNLTVDHKSQWMLGNHEDGYLLGLENLIQVLSSVTS